MLRENKEADDKILYQEENQVTNFLDIAERHGSDRGLLTSLLDTVHWNHKHLVAWKQGTRVSEGIAQFRTAVVGIMAEFESESITPRELWSTLIEAGFDIRDDYQTPDLVIAMYSLIEEGAIIVCEGPGRAKRAFKVGPTFATETYSVSGTYE